MHDGEDDLPGGQPVSSPAGQPASEEPGKPAGTEAPGTTTPSAGTTTPAGSGKKSAGSNKGRGRRVVATLLGFIAAGVIGWIVSQALNHATADVSLRASDVTTTQSVEVAVTFTVTNTGAKAATNCVAYLQFKDWPLIKNSDEPAVPSNGTESFTVYYVPTHVLTFSSPTVWAGCAGAASNKLSFLARAPF
jgi:hypothetical protein